MIVRQEHEMTPGVLVSSNKSPSPAPDIELVAWMWEWRGSQLITTDYRAALELSEPPEPVKVEALVRMSDCMSAIKAASTARHEPEEQYTPGDMADQGAQGWRDGYAWAKGEACMEAAAPAVQGEPEVDDEY